jgi:hypothetical protein
MYLLSVIIGISCIQHDTMSLRLTENLGNADVVSIQLLGTIFWSLGWDIA